MIKFEYQARNQAGELQVGFVHAEDKEGAARKIIADNLYLLAIAEVNQRGVKTFILNFFNKVSQKDIVIFTRQFSTLLESGVSLSQSLRTLAAQTRNSIFKETIIDVQRDIDSGLSLSQAMSKYEHIFSTFSVNMIRSAEITGRVDEVMNFIAEYLEKQLILSSKVRNALIYPVFMVVFLIVIVIFMSIVVFPDLQNTFQQLGAELPAITNALIGFGNFLTNWWWAAFIGLGVIFVSFRDYFKSQEGRIILDEIILRVPIFNKMLKNMYVVRFADSVSVLLQGGVAIVQALEITANTIGSAIYGDILKEVSTEVRNGVLLSQALSKHSLYFPPLITQMIAVGESTGKIDALLTKVSAFYSREVEDLVTNLVEFIQPILMIIIGGVVGMLFASILMPIFNFIGTGMG